MLMFSDHLTPNGGFTFIMLYSKSELKCKFYPNQAIIATIITCTGNTLMGNELKVTGSSLL